MTLVFERLQLNYMKEDFSELIEYLDQKFSDINIKLENKADKSDVRDLVNAVDAYAKKADD